MGGFSIVHWLIVLAVLALIGVPIAKILQRMGYSRWWTLLAFVPLLNWVGLWLVAFNKWPMEGVPDQVTLQ